MKSQENEIKGYVLVRNKDGMPKIVEPLLTPDEVWESLSQEEKDFVNSNVPRYKIRRD